MSGGDSLPAGVRALVELSAALGAGRRRERDETLEEAARRVREGRLEAAAVDEALLQAHLFVGYPAALTALARWRELGPPPAREETGGGGPEDPGRPDAATRRNRGERLCRRIYGEGAYRKLRRRVRRLHPAMDRWMVEEGYGRVLARPGLDVRVRELCVVAMLAAADWPPQLHSHLRGALNVGADPARVTAALEAGAARTGEEPARRARDRWRQVRERAGKTGNREEGPEDLV